jgi:tRNA-2-methylthio-N6-dimethylallyladenosine synthase
MPDDVSEEEKGRRVNEITTLQHEISASLNRRMIGTTERVLIDGESKKSVEEWSARTDTNKVVVFPRSGEQPGDYVHVQIHRVSSATLFGIRVDEPMEEAA